MKSDYNTKQKKLILDYIKSRDGATSAAGIVSALNASGERISPATVYRRLEKMVDEGIIRKYITDKEACFQYVGNGCNGHFHLKCTLCDRLFCVDCDYLSGMEKHILSEHGFTVDNRRTVMYGVCGQCAKKGNGGI